MNASRIEGLVRIVGAGLLGTSIGLALRARGVEVAIEDASPANEKLAIDYGAGRKALPGDNPTLVIVCVPPDVTARVVAAELAAHPAAVVTDVASVKGSILRALAENGVPTTNYVGSHPMAGRERGGAISGRADLFISRPWVIAASADSAPTAVRAVENLALELGAAPVQVGTTEHDRAVETGEVEGFDEAQHLPQAEVCERGHVFPAFTFIQPQQGLQTPEALLRRRAIHRHAHLFQGRVFQVQFYAWPAHPTYS